jgi:hypothetical protein
MDANIFELFYCMNIYEHIMFTREIFVIDRKNKGQIIKLICIRNLESQAIFFLIDGRQRQQAHQYQY